MKYAFFILACSLFIQNSFAVTITSFNDSPAIMNVVEFIKDSANDLKVSNRVSEKQLKITDPSKCTTVNSAAVLNDIQSAVQNVLRYYPDEELPLDEAYADFITLLGSHSYKKCTFSFSNDRMKMMTNYYENDSKSVHIRVDTITLINQ